MKTLKVGLVCIALTLFVGRPALAQTGHDLLQQALVMEQAEGNLQEAIHLYEQIVRDFAADRTLAARALLQMGLCYEKLGSQEAERAYQRVVSDYADQGEIATRARTRLATLRQPPDPVLGSTIVVRQLPSDPWIGDGGPTPDGQSIAFVDYSTGDMALKNLVTGETRRLTREGQWETPGQWGINGAVSPDGKNVAYTWEHQSVIELRVVGMDGSAPRVLCSNTDGRGYPMSWSSDSRHIAVPVYDAEDDTGAVAWVSVEDGSMRELAALPSWEWVALSHSPDDAFVALEFPVEADSYRFDIFLVPTDGSGLISLVDHPADERLLGWLPGTDQLLFLSDRSGQWDAWAIQVVDGQAAGEPRIVRQAMGQVVPMGFSREGSLFYWLSTSRYATSLAPFDVSTGHLEMTAAEPLLGSKIGASWAPEGDRLALLSLNITRPGFGGFSVMVRDLSTGEERLLAEHLDPDRPTWSPDAQSILVAATERPRVEDVSALYRIDVATGEAESLIEVQAKPHQFGGVLSPDGEGLVYVHSGRLAYRHLSSDRETELFQDPGIAARVLDLSPDGDELAFAVNDSLDEEQPEPVPWLQDAGRLMIVPTQGGAVRELARLEGPGTVRNVQWTPDGRHLLYLRSHGNAGSVLWRVAREGGVPEVVWQTDLDLMAISFSPDGSQAAWTTRESGGGEIWVMENLVAALTKGGR